MMAQTPCVYADSVQQTETSPDQGPPSEETPLSHEADVPKNIKIPSDILEDFGSTFGTSNKLRRARARLSSASSLTTRVTRAVSAVMIQPLQKNLAQLGNVYSARAIIKRLDSASLHLMAIMPVGGR